MRCPKCEKDYAKYVTQNNEPPKRKDRRNDAKKRKKATNTRKERAKPRTDFSASCKCGWEGVI